jgi:hypothetical protein
MPLVRRPRVPWISILIGLILFLVTVGGVAVMVVMSDPHFKIPGTR